MVLSTTKADTLLTAWMETVCTRWLWAASSFLMSQLRDRQIPPPEIGGQHKTEEPASLCYSPVLPKDALQVSQVAAVAGASCLCTTLPGEAAAQLGKVWEWDNK